MKKIDVLIKVLLIPLLIVNLYMMITLLGVGDIWGGYLGMISLLLYLYPFVLGVMIVYQFLIKRYVKTPWKQYLALMGFSFLLCWTVIYIIFRGNIEEGVLPLSLFLTLIGVVGMALLSTLFFKNPPLKEGCRAF